MQPECERGWLEKKWDDCKAGLKKVGEWCKDCWDAMLGWMKNAWEDFAIGWNDFMDSMLSSSYWDFFYYTAGGFVNSIRTINGLVDPAHGLISAEDVQAYREFLSKANQEELVWGTLSDKSEPWSEPKRSFWDKLLDFVPFYRNGETFITGAKEGDWKSAGFGLGSAFGELFWMYGTSKVIEGMKGSSGDINWKNGDGYPKPLKWDEKWEWKYPETNNPNVKPRWFDPNGGEWRYHFPDKWHPEGHWDYNPWDSWNSSWENIYTKK